MTQTYYAPRFEIRVEGLTLAADVTDHVTSVTYENNADLADMFTVTLANPDNQLSDLAIFDLGKKVEIRMGYGSELEEMMWGEVTSVEPAYPEGGAPTVTITGYDRSYRLRHNQPDRAPWQYVNDSIIAAQIAVEAGLIPVVDPSPFFHEEIVQTGSDFAFLMERARANYFDVYVRFDRLYFRLPRPQTQATVLEWGKSLSSFSPRLSSASMAGLQVVRGYDEQLAQAVVAFVTSLDLSPENIVERLGSSALDLLVSLGRRVERTENPSSVFDAATFAKSILQQILDGMYEGSGTCIGIPGLRANDMVEIRGAGERFSGMYRLSKVTHTVDDSGYRTSFEVTQKGSSSLLSLLRKSTVDAPAPDKRERFFGVVVAKVVNNVDLEGRGRVKVQYPWFSDKVISPWARVTTPMAGASRGVYFLPDIGDEVLVAFQHGDFNKPIVVGGLWNGPNPPPAQNLDGLNRVRMIKTKAGHTITLDDTLGKETVEIKDKSGSRITLGPAGNMQIEASGDLDIKARNVRVTLLGGTMDVS